MNRDQVKKLFKFLVSIYPTFEVTPEKVDVWSRMMRKMDFERVMAKAERHVAENKFPPTIAEISAYAPEKNEHLEKMRKWEEEAKKVPNDVKEKFRMKMKRLIEEKQQ